MSSRRSKNEINIEDLIDDEATVEDFEEYNQLYPDVDAVTKLKNHCTSCFKHIGLSLASVPKTRLHNVLKVTVCKPCHEFYNSGEFEKGEDGSELFCRWCGQGGVVLCCTQCIYVFCKDCIKRNLGSSGYKKISNDQAWRCFRCDSSQLLEIRARHHAFTNFLLNRQNHVNETAQNASELKQMILEDLSECCGSKVSSKPVESKPIKETETAGPSKPSASETTKDSRKREREESPVYRPGPLSKKKKAQPPAEKPVKDAVKDPPKQQKQPKPPTVPVVPNKTLVVKSKPRKEPSPEPEPEDDGLDIFNLLNPIVELQVPTAEEKSPVDPLADLAGPNNFGFNTMNHFNNDPQHNLMMPGSSMPMTPDFLFSNHFLLGNQFTSPPILSPPIPSMIRPVGIRVPPIAPRPLRPVQTRPNPPGIPVRSVARPLRPSAEPVYHMVNGYRIDLKDAAKKQKITLPDGKVIQVRRQNGDASGGYKTIISTQQTPPLMPQFPHVSNTYRPPMYGNRPVFNNIVPIAPRPVSILRNARPPPRMPTLAPTTNTRVVQQSSPRVVQQPVAKKPRRKTCNAVSPESKDFILSQNQLSAMIRQLEDTTLMVNKKSNNLQNRFKDVKKVSEVIELHCNLNLILDYAQEMIASVKNRNTEYIDKWTTAENKKKKTTPDELQIMDESPACISLDSDDETSEPVAPPTGLRCKTVTEINTGLRKVKTRQVKVISPTKKPEEMGCSEVIDLSDDESPPATDDMDDKTFISGILDDLINSLFPVSEDKENRNPSEATKSVPEVSPEATLSVEKAPIVTEGKELKESEKLTEVQEVGKKPEVNVGLAEPSKQPDNDSVDDCNTQHSGSKETNNNIDEDPLGEELDNDKVPTANTENEKETETTSMETDDLRANAIPDPLEDDAVQLVDILHVLDSTNEDEDDDVVMLDCSSEEKDSEGKDVCEDNITSEVDISEGKDVGEAKISSEVDSIERLNAEKGTNEGNSSEEVSNKSDDKLPKETESGNAEEKTSSDLIDKVPMDKSEIESTKSSGEIIAATDDIQDSSKDMEVGLEDGSKLSNGNGEEKDDVEMIDEDTMKPEDCDGKSIPEILNDQMDDPLADSGIDPLDDPLAESGIDPLLQNGTEKEKETNIESSPQQTIDEVFSAIETMSKELDKLDTPDLPETEAEAKNCAVA